MSQVELWPVVSDQKDKIIRYATERECHGTPKLRHRTVFVVVFNDEGQILMQQRNLHKPLYPGLLTLSASGHVIKDEDYLQAAQREFREELGVEPGELIKVSKRRIDIPKHPTWSVLFRTESNGPFHPRLEEIEGVRFWKIEELYSIRERITPPSQILLTEAGFL